MNLCQQLTVGGNIVEMPDEILERCIFCESLCGPSPPWSLWCTSPQSLLTVSPSSPAGGPQSPCLQPAVSPSPTALRWTSPRHAGILYSGMLTMRQVTVFRLALN